MIEHIEIENFKSLQKVSLDLGPLNIYVGTNASGKTNFLEALRVLKGIGYGYTVDEILNGRPRTAKAEAWEGIRGGVVIHVRHANSTSPSTIRISPEAGTGLLEPSMRIGSVGKIPPLADVQFLQPNPSVLREYSTSARAYRMGDHCEDFAALIKTIMRDDAHANYTSWLKELTPAELDDVVVLGGNCCSVFPPHSPPTPHGTTQVASRARSAARDRHDPLPFTIAWLVVQSSLRQVIAGTLIGLAASWALARWIASLLYGVGGHDPLSFLLPPIALAAVGLMASLAPMLRAARIDPATSLREG